MTFMILDSGYKLQWTITEVHMTMLTKNFLNGEFMSLAWCIYQVSIMTKPEIKISNSGFMKCT